MSEEEMTLSLLAEKVKALQTVDKLMMAHALLMENRPRLALAVLKMAEDEIRLALLLAEPKGVHP